MRRTSARLADGREIVYFDLDGTTPTRPGPDPRELPPADAAPQLRHDVLLDEWVAIAAHRQTRTHLPGAADCPLCPSRAGRRTEVPAAAYQVAVFENRFPALAGDTGRCEVVCFTDEHDGAFAALTVPRARLVLEAFADRTRVLGGLPGVRQVYCFENRGEEIGVTLRHPHGQVYAYPFVTPRTTRMLEVARRRPEVFAEVLAAGRAGPRVVVAGAHWTAFVPVAARWPVEVHVFPHRAVPDLPALTADELDELAAVQLDVLRRLDRLYLAPLPYVAAWHQAPGEPQGEPTAGDRERFRLHLQVFSPRRAADRLKYLAGTESGMGAFSNDVLPEDTARRLHEAG